jgi:hypothetical protein
MGIWFCGAPFVMVLLVWLMFIVLCDGHHSLGPTFPLNVYYKP